MKPAGKRKRKSDYSGNHQRGWLWGHHAVVETLLNGQWPVNEIFVNQSAMERCGDLLRSKQDAGIRLQVVDSKRLEQLSQSAEHQGFLVRLGPFPYRSESDLASHLTDALAGKSTASTASTISGMQSAPVPLVVICDRLQDAFNFGAVLRCCDGANVLGVVVADRAQAAVTPHVARSSSGAVNHLNIYRVADLISAAETIRELGFQLVAADANTNTNIWNSDLTGPTALLIGSEATGIQPELLSICDQRVNIPMQGRVTSLNAAVATGILLYEIRRQQFQSRIH